MMRTAKFIHYIALAFLLCCTSNEAAIRYVDSEAGRDQTGRISNDCLDDSEPCQTLAHTLDQAVTDDAIFLIGEFDEQIEIEKSLTIVGKRSDALAGTFVDCSASSFCQYPLYLAVESAPTDHRFGTLRRFCERFGSAVRHGDDSRL